MGFKDFVSRLKAVPAFLFKPGGPRRLTEAELARMEAEARRHFKDAIARIGNKQWSQAADDIDKARKICTDMGWQEGVSHADYLLDQALAKRAADERGKKARAVAAQSRAKQAARAAGKSAESDHVEKLRKIIKVSDRIEVARLADALDIDEKLAWQRVFDWAEQFGFKVDGNAVVFGAGDTARFVDDLDKEFAEWHADKI
ncbi:MAG: hypothetical protein JW839_21120 [Candidatus Lokiarchaeota archaeon]|nr:hypothetical protein [Candidatus Lokiarchaeota archaeon]